MKGTNGKLFDLSGYNSEQKERKKPQSEAEKRLEEIEEMEGRDFKNLKMKLTRGESLMATEAKRLHEYRKRYIDELGVELSPGVVKTQREVADFFECHIQTIKNWCSKGMPRRPDSYELAAIKTWAIAEGLIKNPGRDVDDKDNSGENESEEKDRAYWEKANTKAQAESRQLKNQILEKKLIYAEAAYRQFFEATRSARDALLNIGPHIATDLASDDEERRQILESYNKKVTKILQGLSDRFDAKCK